MSVVPLRMEKIFNVDAWLQIIRGELVDVKKCFLLFEQEDGSRNITQFHATADDATLFAALFNDYARRKREEEHL